MMDIYKVGKLENEFVESETKLNTYRAKVNEYIINSLKKQGLDADVYINAESIEISLPDGEYSLNFIEDIAVNFDAKEYKLYVNSFSTVLKLKG